MAEHDPIRAVVERWRDHLASHDHGLLDDLLDDDCVFISPIVFTPQVGKAITKLYLSAASVALPGEAGTGGSDSGSDSGSGGGIGGFRYTKQVLDGHTAVLEFETSIEGKYVNGVDIITCNDAGKIVEFRVMIRPLQAVHAVHEQMKAQLERMQQG